MYKFFSNNIYVNSVILRKVQNNDLKPTCKKCFLKNQLKKIIKSNFFSIHNFIFVTG